MSIIFGGDFPSIVLDWRPDGNYRVYLSADKDGFYITLKDEFVDNVWGRITTIQINHKGELVEQKEFTSADGEVTSNQQDWRKNLAHAFTAPAADPDPCIDQYRFFNNANLESDSEALLPPDRIYQSDIATFQAIAGGSGELEVDIDVDTCSPVGGICEVTDYVTGKAKFQGIDNNSVNLVAIAAVEIDAN